MMLTSQAGSDGSLGLLKTAMTNEPNALSIILEESYATAENKKGEDYEPDSLRVVFFHA